MVYCGVLWCTGDHYTLSTHYRKLAPAGHCCCAAAALEMLSTKKQEFDVLGSTPHNQDNLY